MLIRLAIVAVFSAGFLAPGNLRAADKPPFVNVESVSTNKAYKAIPIEPGTKAYIDRAYELTTLSERLQKGWLVQTANDDDYATGDEHLVLSFRGPAAVYFAYDDRAKSPPAWLKDWEPTEEKLRTSDSGFHVYRREFANRVVLGANDRKATGNVSHYLVVVVPLEKLSQPPAPKGPPVDFSREIQPLLANYCYECHGPKTQEAGLRLDVRRRALLGGDSGLAIARFSPQKSELIARITHADNEERMPPEKPLVKEQIDLLKRWIEDGAPWPDEFAGQEQHSDHWSFQPIKRPRVPAVNDKAIVGPIDAFILAKLEANGLTFAPKAARAALLRRLSLDLIGLPPKAAELQAFLGDTTDHAYDKAVERLLASPHFGERWGRHWLDLARYAESDGYENDKLRPNAWRYRDWVVEAVNRDMPFDQFTIEQLAGDLLPNATPAQRTATGFHRNTLWNSAASADKEEFRVRAAKDRTETTATTWLGLTLGCAQCHSHKYDPIAHREYYQFFAFFNSTDDDSVAVAGGEAMALKTSARKSHVHLRGDFLRLGSEVAGGTPAFLPEMKQATSQASRLDLAKWIVDPQNPLTARVAANHIWQHLFGQGLVASPENFGKSGEPPSHPELLDWLASELMQRGWSRKDLIRQIVHSQAYQQSSRVRPEVRERDPDNRLLARQNRFRAEAEVVRDASLAVSGLLDEALGGPSIVPPFPDGLLSHRLTAEVLKEPTKEHHRRSIYIHVQRTLTHPSLAAFDAADGNNACVRRDRSITPTQALTLLNDPVYLECTKALGERLQKLAVTNDERLNAAFELCLARKPSDQERELLTKLIARQQELGASEAAIWHGVARAILNLDEFSTRE